jgi:hypothetical protein
MDELPSLCLNCKAGLKKIPNRAFGLCDVAESPKDAIFCPACHLYIVSKDGNLRTMKFSNLYKILKEWKI